MISDPAFTQGACASFSESRIVFVVDGVVVVKLASSSRYCFNINIATWNVRGLNQAGELANIIQEMEELKFNVLGLAETFWKEAGEFDANTLTSESKHKVIFSGGDKGRRGVALIVKETVSNKIFYYNTHNERIMTLKLKGSRNDVLLIQIYAPNKDDGDAEKDKFYEELNTIIKNNQILQIL